MKLHALALSTLAAATIVAAHAGVIDKSQTENQATGSSQTWSAWGGQIGVRWNHDLLDSLGVTPGKPPTGKLTHEDNRHHEWFELRQSTGLQFSVSNAALRQFTGGSVQMRGGF